MKANIMAVGLVVLAAAAGEPEGGVSPLRPMVAAAETVSIKLPPDLVALEPGPGMDQTQTQCRMCHSLDYITTQPRVGAPQWEGVVTKMMKVFGAPVSEPEAKVISAYLAKHYGTLPRGQ